MEREARREAPGPSVLALSSGSACSADAVTAPEPALETPGAFVAWLDRDDERLRLFRTVAPTSFASNDLLLLGILYADRPESFEQARELARRHDLPEQVHQYFVYGAGWAERALQRPSQTLPGSATPGQPST